MKHAKRTNLLWHDSSLDLFKKKILKYDVLPPSVIIEANLMKRQQLKHHGRHTFGIESKSVVVGNRVAVGTIRSAIRLMLRVKVNNVRLGVSPSVTLTGQHPWLRPGWKILPIRMGYCSNTKWARRFQCEDKNLSSHRLWEVTRHSSWAFELLTQCLNNNNNNSFQHTWLPRNEQLRPHQTLKSQELPSLPWMWNQGQAK